MILSQFSPPLIITHTCTNYKQTVRRSFFSLILLHRHGCTNRGPQYLGVLITELAACHPPGA